MNKLLPYILIILAAILMVAAFFLGTHSVKPQNIIKQDTVIHTRTDTIRDTITEFKLKPYPKETIKMDTLYLKDTTLVKKTDLYQETFHLGKDTAEVTILATGILTHLDSIGIKLRTMRTHTTETVEVIKYVEGKKKRMNIGLQGGYGYGFKSKTLEPYIGIGITIDI